MAVRQNGTVLARTDRATPDTAEPTEHCPPFDVVGVVASAGGLSALSVFLEDMPAGLPVPITVVQHLDPRHRSLMAELLGRRTELAVKEATDGEAMSARTVYVAPPNRHLLVRRGGTLSLSDAELVHFVRPSGDLLFESLAASYGDRVIAVVLSGTGKDGSMGVRAVKQVGGTVIAQDPAGAEFDGMPASSIATSSVDFVLPLEAIGPAVVALVSEAR